MFGARTVACMACCSVLGWMGAAAVERSAQARPAEAYAAAVLPQEPPGKAIFDGKGNCAVCHGRDAKGTQIGPDLTDGEWLHFTGAVELEELVNLIRDGVDRPKSYPAPMPPMGGARLTAEEIEAVAAYVLALGPRPEDGEDAFAGGPR